MTITANPLTMLLLLPWSALWLAGGVALAGAAFRLRPNEQLVVGIATGWLAQNWLANLLGQALPVLPAFWASAVLVFMAGGVFFVRAGWKIPGDLKISLPQVLLLALVTFFYYEAGRGMAIFDDFQHLPTASVMAAGDFPPHFVLDPKVVFGYHHFLLLFSAQLIRVGGLSPWVAVDASRALAFGLAVMLSALFAQRLTRSLVGGLLGGLVIAFGSGTRWLLLLVPPAAVAWLGRGVQLIGSGAGSGANLGAALVNSWAVEGAGPVAFPFAFANGIFPAGVVQGFTANGLTSFVVIFLLLLTFNRWRGGLSAVLSAIVISVWGLLGEAEIPTLAAGWAIVALAWIITTRSFRLPRALWVWLSTAAAGCIIGVVEGGALTDILVKALARISGNADAAASYQTISFQLGAPAVVSSHLGVLAVFNPASLLVALFELGPVLLVFPLLAAWGIKAFRLQRWYEAATAATAGVGLLMLFVQFAGSTGVRNTPRLYVFMPLLAAFAAPLFWMWASNRSSTVKTLTAGLGVVLLLGGVVMAGSDLVAIQRPVYSYFLTPLDARMARAHWNRLEPGTLVFDSIPYRAPTIFGRPTDSNDTWYQSKPAWDALVQAPDPAKLRDAGFRYLYLDNQYWDGLTPQIQAALKQCGRVMDEADDPSGTFRRLIDLQGCQ